MKIPERGGRAITLQDLANHTGVAYALKQPAMQARVREITAATMTLAPSGFERWSPRTS